MRIKFRSLGVEEFGSKFISNSATPQLRNSFTLIELLIAAAIFSCVSLAIYGTFSSGMNIWRRIGELNITEKKNILKVGKIERELRQAFIFRANEIPWRGKKEEIGFPAIIDSEICGVNYVFDVGRKELLRTVDRLADILARKDKEKKDTAVSKSDVYLSGVKSVDFSYFYFDLNKAAYGWSAEWMADALPKAVKLEIGLEDEKYSTVVFILTA